MTEIVNQLIAASDDLPIVFPVHPRTQKKLLEFGLRDGLVGKHNIRLVDPLGYLQFMNLVVSARAVITDSGGVQEESTYLRIPCLTLRENTERPVTLAGSNRLVKAENLAATIKTVLDGTWTAGDPPTKWDGHTAERCVQALKRRAGIGT